MFRAFLNYAAELDILKDTARVFQSTGATKLKGNKRHVLRVMHQKELLKTKHFQLQSTFSRQRFTGKTVLNLSTLVTYGRRH